MQNLILSNEYDGVQIKGKNTFIETLYYISVYAVTMFPQLIIMLFYILPITLSDPKIKDIIESGVIPGSEELSNIITDTLNNIINSNAFSLLNIYLTVFPFAIFVFYMKKFEKRSWRQIGFVKKRAVPDYLIGFAVGFLMIFAAVMLSALTGHMEFNGLNPDVSIFIIIAFFIGFLIQGMNEEIVFRSGLLIAVAKKSNVFTGILISSVIFSLAHIGNMDVTPLALLNILLFGLFSAIYFVKKKNIWGVAAIHSAWNFMQGNIFGIEVSGMKMDSLFTFKATGSELINDGSFGLEGGLAITIVLAVGILILLLVDGSISKKSEKVA